MKFMTNYSSSLGILLLSACSFSFATPQNTKPLPSMPADDVIKRESAKQIEKSPMLIDRALLQSLKLNKAVPDIETVAIPIMPDPAKIAKQFQEMELKSKPDNTLLVMVSFSMPEESIARIAEQAKKAGATLVLRGLVDDSMKKTAELAFQFIKQYPGVHFQIDPTLFKRYAVKKVPTFILARENKSIKSCTKGCDASDYFVSVSGDVTLDYALDYFTRFGGPHFGLIAEKNLKMIRAN